MILYPSPLNHIILRYNQTWPWKNGWLFRFPRLQRGPLLQLTRRCQEKCARFLHTFVSMEWYGELVDFDRKPWMVTTSQFFFDLRFWFYHHPDLGVTQHWGSFGNKLVLRRCTCTLSFPAWSANNHWETVWKLQTTGFTCKIRLHQISPAHVAIPSITCLRKV